MAGLMVAAAVLSALLLPRLPAVAAEPRSGGARNDLLGFAAVLAAVALGVVLTDRFGPPAWRARCWAAGCRAARCRHAAGALGRPGRAAAGHRLHAAAGGLGGAAGALRHPAGRACATTSASRAPGPSWR
jgi:hypothetical protein